MIQRKGISPLISLCWYTAATALALLLLIVTLRLDRADLAVPIDYVMQPPESPATQFEFSGGGDSYFTMMLFRVICETGSPNGTPSLGAPMGMDLRDHPIIDSLYVTMARVLCRLTGNFGIAINLFYLLGYPLATLSCMFCLRRLRVAHALAMACGILFAFLPYHLWRGQGHLFLGHYWPIPFVVLTAIWLATGRRFARRAERKGRRRSRISSRTVIAALAVLLAGCAGVYYGLFSLFILSCASLMRLSRVRSWRSLWAPAAILVGLLLVIGVNAMPFVVYRLRVGLNPEAVVRVPAQSEYFALKPIQLLLPVEGHRVPALRTLAETYANTSPLITENRMSSLGMFGAIGLLILVAWLLGLRWRNYRVHTMTAAAQLTLAMLLLGMIGGIGSILAYCVSPALRSYTRVSVFIAFLALLALAYAIQRVLAFRQVTSRKTLLLTAVVPGMILLGLLDQVPQRFIPLYEQGFASYTSDRQFVKDLESRLPAGAMIFQLPYTEFPEGNSPAPYELFKPYLHTMKLRWSFGAMHGRDADKLIRFIMSLAGTPRAFIGQLVEAGYAGVYLDRALDPDHTMETYLRKNIVDRPVESSDKRLLYFPLVPAPSSAATRGSDATAKP